ncbi:hypothetical protein KY290_010837 [Solanum tuberosum]|uniref:Uncharacterized protein n=1 Tax=Solanum tuberosum TaxID=4113 RepID=A0ABQ7W0Y8_SOLTU|nr:hypothetical protein KY290_010837 [Solanum tuberosum]
MSFVTSEYCGDDIGEYACSNMSYENGENEFCEGYDGPYEHGNGDLVYDGDSYEGYDSPWDNEQHGGENHYSGDDFEMNGTYDSSDDVEGMEEPYGVYHCGDEGSHATHYGYDGDVRYNSFSQRSYEFFEQNLDRNGGCEVEFTTSSCATSYPKKEGIHVWVGPFQSRRVDHRRSTFPTSQNMLTYSSHPSSNVSCSLYGDEVEGRGVGALSHEVIELRETFTTLREDFDDFLRMFEMVTSMVQKRQVIHHENTPKELPLDEKQDTPSKVGTKEFMEVKTLTPCAPKWKLNLKGSSNPSKGILGTCPNSHQIERQRIERSKDVKSDNSRVEKGEVGWSILGSKPSEAPQNVNNHEILESFQNEKMCSNVDSQGDDTSSYELQGNNANAYTSLNLEHHCVASSPLSINNSLSLCEHSESLPCDVLDSTFLCDDNILVVNLCSPSVGTCSLNEGTLSCDESDATLVDPIDDQVDSSEKINLCPPSVGINDLNESLDHSTISCFSHVNLEVECLLKDNLLFDDDMTIESVHSEIPYNVGSVATLSGYQLFENPLWCDDTLSKDGNLFCEDDSTFIGEGSVKMKGDAYVLNVTSSLCVPILHMNCASFINKVEAKLGNNLIEVHLCDTFLYYLFAYDDVSTFEWSTMILEDKGANRVNKGVLDPCSWISFPFHPGNELNCGICLVMLGQDDKNNLEGFVGAFPYDGKFFLRVYNLLEGPTLCIGKGLDSRTNPFQEGEDDNNMDSMDRVKALEKLDGHKIKKYNVWKVHLSEEKEERGHLCIWSTHNFKNSQKKTTKQDPYLIKGKIVKENKKKYNKIHVDCHASNQLPTQQLPQHQLSATIAAHCQAILDAPRGACGSDSERKMCSNVNYEHGENEFCEGYDGPYEHGNGDLVYDGDSYEGYDGPWDNEQDGGENYYSGDDFEMNGTYDSSDDVEGMEEPYGVYHCGDKGSHATHYGYEGDVTYNSFSHRSYESFEQNLDRNGGCEVEFTTSSCATSYPKKEGIHVWVGPFQSRRVDHRRSTFPTSQNMLIYSSHPSSNVSCSLYGDEVEGLGRNTKQ